MYFSQTHPHTETRILIIDDDDLVRGSLKAFLLRRGFLVEAAEDGPRGLKALARNRPDVVLLDLRMPGMDGLEVLAEIRRLDPDLPVIVASGAGVMDDVMQSLRLGAWDFLLKPFADLEILFHAVGNAVDQSRLRRENRAYHLGLEKKVARRTAELEEANRELAQLRLRLEQENEYLRSELFPVDPSGLFVGTSRELKLVQAEIEKVAPTDAPVLITGETGTGKELAARCLHQKSRRRDKPLIKVNCASIPRELFESEFFGHIKGAFTGAVQDRVGRFQLADKGTLFLDEVAEIPKELQVKLLRVIQEGEFERVGEALTRKVDVRIVAATNRDLIEEIRAGRFREDLYFRLNVYPLTIPPLREHKDDIALLAQHFLSQEERKLGKKPGPLKIKHIRELESYPWPGNVRELQNVIERAVIMGDPGELHFELDHGAIQTSGQGKDGGESLPAGAGEILTEAQIRQLERENIKRALAACGGRVAGPRGAAAVLGIKPTTLASRMKVLNIARPERKARG